MENKKEYSIDATGDCCQGDEVQFEKAVFTGTYPKARFSHNETITGTIIKDSYGEAKQQHTFTIELTDGNKMKIKGRNLYRNGVKRKPWINEEDRKVSLEEKHTRGTEARAKAYTRKQLRGYY